MYADLQVGSSLNEVAYLTVRQSLGRWKLQRKAVCDNKPDSILVAMYSLLCFKVNSCKVI